MTQENQDNQESQNQLEASLDSFMKACQQADDNWRQHPCPLSDHLACDNNLTAACRVPAMLKLLQKRKISPYALNRKFHGMPAKPETPKVGVGVFLKDISGKILLGLRKGSHGEGQWSLPGGHMELGEEFLQTCQRETYEETGITIIAVKPAGFVNHIFEEEGLHYVTLFFEAAWDQIQEAKLMEPNKTDKWGWFDINHLPTPIFPCLRKILEKNAQ